MPRQPRLPKMEEILKQWAMDFFIKHYPSESDETHELAEAFFNELIKAIEIENKNPSLFAAHDKSLRKLIEADVYSLSPMDFFIKHYPPERDTEACRVLYVLETYRDFY